MSRSPFETTLTEHHITADVSNFHILLFSCGEACRWVGHFYAAFAPLQDQIIGHVTHLSVWNHSGAVTFSQDEQNQGPEFLLKGSDW